ncbi:hypothetical protein CDD81_4900 [Ophiocordyceps australis]|uniref:Rab-GAP TBC domain-containing protein n=1 Tax=Ophiocordyceps australis TaxID=1399860 RepID=A0A2C5Y955_9HYPO|nr:hypothetical protein CDD81_4900 [Ophiocordyceps australis]
MPSSPSRGALSPSPSPPPSSPASSLAPMAEADPRPSSPSPRSYRALRRLQSAHALGATRTGNQPSLISQQRRHLYRSTSPSGDYNPRPLSNRSPSRLRANSEATSPSLGHHNTALGYPITARRVTLKSPVFSHGHLSLQQIIRDGPNDDDFQGALESARWKVVDQGIKSAEDGMSTLRIYVWLVLLDTPIMSTDEYLTLVHRGASPAYSKIRNDTFRTLTTDPLFRRRVSEASLIRLLNAVAWKLHDAKEGQRQSRPSSQQSSHYRESLTGSVSGTSQAKSSVGPEPGTYVQGMNVLAAPFLYAARSEGEAFVAFYSLLTRECPAYIRGAMDGVHRGLALVDKVLAIVDPKLSMYLTAKGLSAEIYAFPSVLTLCACTPPLPEVLRLWDFLFAYGPHLNILCIVAQLTIMRSQILQSPSPNKVLRSFPQLNADLVKSVTIGITKQIPDDVYAEIVVHAL